MHRSRGRHRLGGATSEDNLRLLCRRCNQEKGARI
ncbi:HNH endonuclease [Kineococcus rhizosphaerae]|nr:HNH endonuclease [Kineococcus rhizosphaerae]